MHNLISWFEIPAADLKRAAAFYSQVIGTEVPVQSFGGFKIAFFPSDDKNVSGAIVEHKVYVPSHQGVLIYLDGGNDLNTMLSRVEPAGGKVLQAKKLISPDVGYMALFQDTEGNRIAIHSRQ